MNTNPCKLVSKNVVSVHIHLHSLANILATFFYVNNIFCLKPDQMCIYSSKNEPHIQGLHQMPISLLYIQAKNEYLD